MQTLPPLASTQEHRLPPPVPISESSDPDAIALRSALSVLQIQRLRSIQDVRTLNRQKEKALADPEAFAKALAGGNVRTQIPQDLLGILEDEQTPNDDHHSDSPSSMHDANHVEAETGSNFTNIPKAQNVVRCPPINWAKYRVVGEALETLHEQQQLRPPNGQLKDAEISTAPYLIAAPYSPWRDKLPSNPAEHRPDPSL